MRVTVDEFGSETFFPGRMKRWSIFLTLTEVFFASNIIVVTTAFGTCTIKRTASDRLAVGVEGEGCRRIFPT